MPFKLEETSYFSDDAAPMLPPLFIHARTQQGEADHLYPSYITPRVPIVYFDLLSQKIPKVKLRG